MRQRKTLLDELKLPNVIAEQRTRDIYYGLGGKAFKDDISWEEFRKKLEADGVDSHAIAEAFRGYSHAQDLLTR